MKRIYFIFKRLRGQIYIKDAKVEVLENYWNKFYGQLQYAATQSGNSQAKKICE